MGTPLLVGAASCLQTAGSYPAVPRVGGRGRGSSHTACPSFPCLAPRVPLPSGQRESGSHRLPPTCGRCAPHTARSWAVGTVIWTKLICYISLLASGGLLHPSTRPHQKAKTPRRETRSTMRERTHAKAWQGGWRTGGPPQTASQNPATSAAPRPELSTSAALLKHRNE